MLPPRRAASVLGRSLLAIAVAIFVAALTLYLLTLSRNYSMDSMAFAVLATRGRLDERLFFQAEHLLYPFVGWLWYRLWALLGYEGGALIPLQVLNALFGALGVAAYFLALRLALGEARRDFLISLTASLALAVSYGYWYHSTEAEDQIIADSLVLGAFLALIARRAGHEGVRQSRQIPGCLLCAVAAGLTATAILAHATQVLFLPALLMGLRQGKATQREWLWALGVLAATISMPFVLVGLLVHGYRTPGEFAQWFLSAPGHGIWGRPGVRSLWQAVQTLANTMVYLQGMSSLRAALGDVLYWRNMLAILAFVGVIAALLLSFGYLMRHRRHLPGSGLVILCLLWLAPYGLFNIYWAPEDIQFWVILLPPLFILASLAFALFTERHSRHEELWYSLLTFALAALFVVNLITAIAPRARLVNNEGYFKALCVGQMAGPGDLIVTPGWDWASAYIPYFTDRKVLSLIDVGLLEAGRDRARLLNILRERIAATERAGGHVYIVRLFSLTETERSWLRGIIGLEPEDFYLPVRQASSCLGEQVWEVPP